jgi:hypothetical protein
MIAGSPTVVYRHRCRDPRGGYGTIAFSPN